MRILTWNINGIRTLPQYHPWNALKTCEAILGELGADIVCFQEMKITRAALDSSLALPGSHDSFFSFPISKGGYSGVAVYTNSKTAVPVKAEEGISGRLQPKVPLTPEERISPTYPLVNEINWMPDEDGNTPSDFMALDSEGRALVLDFGLFALINLYCPNETSEARLPFKMNFHYLMQERVRKLVEEGREVIVVGDINITSAPIDHCDGHLASNTSAFYDHPARAWFRDWTDPVSGPLVDVVRTFWPERKGMYTCWNTKISARDTNYGTRIDYFLVTRGLLPWIKHGDILPSLKGSDHCPVYIDLYNEIALESGQKTTLKQAMHMDGERREPPRLAAKFWDEFSTKQTKLLSFFGKQSSISQPPISPPSVSLSPTSSQTHSPPSSIPPLAVEPRPKPTPTLSSQKRKPIASAPDSVKNKKQRTGQTKLSTFFKAPITSTPSLENVIDLEEEPTASQLESDYRLALELSSQENAPLESGPSKPPPQSKAAWSQLMAPIQPPKCTGHDEPAKEFTVNKPGPNRGKTFFVCARPVGPGYDKGRTERRREEVDPQYKCSFFKWFSEVKRETLKAQVLE